LEDNFFPTECQRGCSAKSILNTVHH